MQDKKTPRRSNRDRTAETRAKLIEAARTLFVEKGYAETGTPEIVKAASVTRGALYHHFDDKAALFRAVVEAEAAAVTQEIDRVAIAATSAQDGLETGGDAYFTAMSEPGRARLLLLDGPAVLGASAMRDIDEQNGGESLRDGLAEAMGPAAETVPLDALADILSAAFDRAALAIANGAPPAPYKTAVHSLVSSLLTAKGVKNSHQSKSERFS